MKKLGILCILLLASIAGAQTINPNQIRPGSNGQVLTTSSGVTGWGTGNFTLGSTNITLGGTFTTITGLTINGVSLTAAGSSSLFLNQAGGYTAPTVSAPTFDLIGSGTNITMNSFCGTGCSLQPSGTGTIKANAVNLAATGNGGVTGNLSIANFNGGSGASLTTFWAGDGTWKTISIPAAGVTSINGVAGAFTFAGTGVSCALTTCTFGGGGSSGISGLTAGWVPLAGSATTLTANSHINEVSTPGSTTVTQPLIINDGTGNAGSFGLQAGTAPASAPANTIQFQAPTSVTAYSATLPSAQGTGALTNDGAGNLSWTVPGACATCVTSAASLTNHALMLGAGLQASSTMGSLGTTTTVLHGNAAGAPSFAVVTPSDASGNTSGSGNFVLVTSPTLVTPALGAATATSLLASGNVDGTAPVTITTGTTGSIGGTFKSGYTLNQEATAATAVAYTLPTAAAGLQYCVGNSWNGSAATTGVLTVNASASGQFIIFTDGTLSATGGNVTSGGAAADAACFVGVDSTHWQQYTQRGTWTKH